MGQQEVLDFLKKHPSRWFSTKEISAAIGGSSPQVSLAKLRRDKCISWKLDDHKKFSRYKILYYKYRK